MIRIRSCCLLAGVALMTGGQALAAAPTNSASKIDAKADKILRAMTTYLAGLKSFTAKTESSIDVVTSDGLKLQFDIPTTVSVARPNKLFAERNGDIVKQAFYYDGKNLTLYNPESKAYATVAAPATLDAMLDFAADKLDIVAPAGDLIDSDAYARLTGDVVSSAYLGIDAVAGQSCHHLVFRASEVDWQLWVRSGDTPVPCKYLITSKNIAGSPQFSTEILEWDTKSKLPDSKFTFVAPPGANAIEFLPATTASNPSAK